MILDGHHRFAAAKLLGLTRLPCLVIKYNSSVVTVTNWNTGEKFDKSKIISDVLTGNLLEHKSTKHTFNCETPIFSALHINELKVNLL